jgi:hypothetical protein
MSLVVDTREEIDRGEDFQIGRPLLRLSSFFYGKWKPSETTTDRAQHFPLSHSSLSL